ncbi:hypothetical protein GCM10027449_18480 [Sinomonas notoginsengisoli]|uniref:hypothetical protein n=1 Tax=Sinomonas notoginsengisoli TaxID=1457311 RepID=UPI001F2FB775|nr:hypothetical protein [Sinomonas notoginsengisoli]
MTLDPQAIMRDAQALATTMLNGEDPVPLYRQLRREADPAARRRWAEAVTMTLLPWFAAAMHQHHGTQAAALEAFRRWVEIAGADSGQAREAFGGDGPGQARPGGDAPA